MNRSPVEVVTSEFEFSHGRAPRGFGSWAFEIGCGREIFWVHQSRFAPARAAAVREARRVGENMVTVMP